MACGDNRRLHRMGTSPDQFLLTSLVLCVVLLSLATSTASPSAARKHPHIIFMVADDLGWNDVGFHNPDIISPNLDNLAKTGIVLNQSYVQPVCSPSRSSFMTGYYPFRMGLQHLVIVYGQAVCAPEDKTFLPQVLKSKGYATHAVGKWHLGFCNWNCTPTYRGFDSFYGYYTAMEDYYNKTVSGGYDFRDDTKVDKTGSKNYSSFQYAERVTSLIQRHNASQPFFLYFPIQSVHSPLEVPSKYYDMYPNVSSEGRRTFSGMVTAMDDVVGRMVQALKDNNMYEDTVIFFTSDNGGWTAFHGNNFPLRGGKLTVWEGGTRVPGFVHYPKLKDTGFVHDGMIHAVDWFHTIVEAGGISYSDQDSDGVSQWRSITEKLPSKRHEFVYNLDNHSLPLQGKAAIRVGDYKLIDGFPGLYNGWYTPGTECDEIPWSIENYQVKWMDVSDDWIHFKGLYNLRDDPEERINLYNSHPQIVTKLRTRLDTYRKKMVPANFPVPNPASNPKNFDGTWSPGWC